MTSITVVIPCFNGAEFVETAIASVLSQTLPPAQIIVVDDASTDNSAAVIQAAAARDGRILPIFLTTNGGPAAARNKAFAAATGEWITLLDADDLYEPDRLRFLADLANEKDADVVADNLSIRDYGSSKHLFSALPHVERDDVVSVDREFFFQNAWNGAQKYGMGILKPMFRTKFIRDNSVGYEEKYRIGEDLLFYIHCMLSGANFVLSGKPNYIYQRRGASISNVGAHAFQTLADMCDEMLSTETRLTARDKSHLRRRKAGLLGYYQWRQLRGLKDSGQWGKVARHIASNPSVILYVMKMKLEWRKSQSL